MMDLPDLVRIVSDPGRFLSPGAPDGRLDDSVRSRGPRNDTLRERGYENSPLRNLRRRELRGPAVPAGSREEALGRLRGFRPRLAGGLGPGLAGLRSGHRFRGILAGSPESGRLGDRGRPDPARLAHAARDL